MWVDLSKKNGSRPEFIFTCNDSIEEVLHSGSHGRNCISGAHRPQKSTVNKKHMQLHTCEVQRYCCILICVTFHVVNRDENCCQKQK